MAGKAKGGQESGCEGLGALDRYLRVRHSHPHGHLPWLWLGKRGRLTGSGILFAHLVLVRGATEGAVAALAGWKDRAMLARYGRYAEVERAVAEYRRLDAQG